jgi:hypothetical protein
VTMAIRIFFFEPLLELPLDLLELSSDPHAARAAAPQTSTATSNHLTNF